MNAAAHVHFCLAVCQWIVHCSWACIHLLHSGQCSSEQHCDAADINAGAGQDMSFVDSKKRCRCEFKLQLLVSPCRFFLGGVSSLRGFHADRVGPSEPRLGSHLQVQLFLLSGNSACHSPCHLMVIKTCTLIWL